MSLTISTAVSSSTASASIIPQCSNISTLLDITTTVREFPTNFDISQFNLTSAPDLPSTNASGNYTIAASLCQPLIEHHSASDTLQILVHGSYYTRSYWSGLETPPQSINGTEYSWIDYASSRGFATLAIDRLCNGMSSHPNESQACQIENQVAILNKLVSNARAGRYGGKSFSRVILVGHSLGSLTVQAFTRAHPNAVNEVILTGFSDLILRGNQETASSGGFGRPSKNQEKMAKNNSLGSTYSTLTNRTVFVDSFYSGDFNISLAEYNFKISGTFNIFEAATSAFGQLPAPSYTGTVIVLNGEEDRAVCGGDCGKGARSLTARVRSLYPSARNFLWHNTANTGHCLNLHLTAQESYQRIFDDLEKCRF